MIFALIGNAHLNAGDGLGIYDRRYAAERTEEYKTLTLRPNPLSPTRYDDTARLLREVNAGGSCLEIGCGRGSLLFALADRFDRLVGVDATNVRIEAARRFLQTGGAAHADKMEFIQGDATEPLPFDDDEFDVAIACAIIEHCEDLFAVVDELARVTRPGGYLVVTVPNICYIKHVLGLLVGKTPLTGTETRQIDHWRETGWDGGHLHYFSKASLHDLLRNVGFEPEKTTGDGKYAKLRRWCTNLVGTLTVRARKR
jgi:SAM-dependent methyltransferase